MEHTFFSKIGVHIFFNVSGMKKDFAFCEELCEKWKILVYF